MQEIEITIDKEGNVDIDLLNFHGQGCSLASEAMAKALGTVIKRDQKHEYWQQDTAAKQSVRRS